MAHFHSSYSTSPLSGGTAINTQLSFIEWIFTALQLIVSENISFDVRHRSDRVLEATLISLVRINGTHTGIRKSAILAIDSSGAEIPPADVERFCLEYSAQFSVIESFLLSTGAPSSAARLILNKHGVRFVEIGGPDFSPPTKDKISNLAQLLLGALPVQQIISQVEQLIGDTGSIEDEQDSQTLIELVYESLFLLYFFELELLTDRESRRSVVSNKQSGEESALSEGYAIVTGMFEGQQKSFFFPSLAHINWGISVVASTHEMLLRIKRQGFQHFSIELLTQTSQQFLSYYLSWLDGRKHDLPCEKLRSAFPLFIDIPYISLLSARLNDFDPAKQISVLESLRHARAQAAAPDLLACIDSLLPRVQEECLKSLATFGTLRDPSLIEPFLMSPRESVQNAALDVLGSMGGDGAALNLVTLINNGTVPISISVLKAIGQTRSAVGLATLVEFGFHRKVIEQAFLDVIESCLNSLESKRIRHEAPKVFPSNLLEKYVAFLFESENSSAKRLALKLIAAFQISACLPYIEKALEDEFLVSRVDAIKAIALFPQDELVQAMVESLANLPEDYETKKLMEWFTVNMTRRQTGESQRHQIVSVADLDIKKAVLDSLAKAGTKYAEQCLKKLREQSPVPEDKSESAESEGPESVALVNSVFECPNGPIVWVNHTSRERNADDIAFAFILHSNKFENTMGIGEAASMSSRGVSVTQGTEREIFEDVVFPYLREEKPRFPVSAGMQQMITSKIEDGKTVIDRPT